MESAIDSHSQYSHYRTLTDRQQIWLSYRIYSIYRCGLAVALFLLYRLNTGTSIVGQHDHELFEYTSIFYLFLAFTSLLCFRAGYSYRNPFIAFIILSDIVILMLLMHASGGISSGLGILMAIPVVSGGLLINGRAALAFAAIASLSLLAEQVFADISRSFESSAYGRAGMLGGALFATALLAHVMGRRLAESNAISRHRATQLAQMQLLNEYVVQHLQAGVIICNAHEKIVAMNTSAQSAFGLQGPAQSLEELPDELRQSYTQWQADPRTENHALFVGTQNEIQLRFTRIGNSGTSYTLIFMESSSVTNQRIQQGKLASLGTLTASIAHEIRNPLSAIAHAAQLLAESPEISTPERAMVDIIEKQGKRVNRVIENVLQLSRKSPPHRVSVNLKPWLDQFADEYRLTHRDGKFSITVESGSPPLPVAMARMDEHHLHQILSCLCDNARAHAGDSPSITIRLLSEKKHPTILVSDNGAGISQSDQLRIFEPFFSTASQGSGLGLYIAKELAELNQSLLEYIPPDSSSDSGFHLTLANDDEQLISL